ncbi:MAG TPA: PrsW family glutamic-type intramembrane protease [Candidatus Paceibacterota bacterium]
MDLMTAGYAFLAGILPPLIWLYLLLKEDAKHPEPKSLIALTFAAGMVAVPLVLPFEQAAVARFSGEVPLLFSWALIEEVAKYAAVALVVLWRPAVDEPIDYVIYMLTAALGFAALENTLFIFGPFEHGQVIAGLATGNLRFMGSTLVHVISSSALGFSMAFTYRKAVYRRMSGAAVGLILAVGLHGFFNFLILSAGGSLTLLAFFLVWTAALVIFAFFEVLQYRESHRARATS